MANHYEGIAGKVREELALDEVNEEPEEFNDYMSIATMIIAKHILECAKDLEDIGFNLEYMSTARLFAYLRHCNILGVIFLG